MDHMSGFVSRRSATLLLFFILAAIPALAQRYEGGYSPLRTFKPAPETVVGVTASYKLNIKALDTIKEKKVRESVAEDLKSLSTNFTRLDSMSLLMHTDSLNGYVNSITQRICSKNPSLAGSTFKIFTYRTIIPNASSRGNGVLFINLDLAAKLSSEAELAFIICHEMAHDVRKHVMKGILQRSQMIHDDNFKKELKKATSQEFNSVKVTETVVLKFMARYTEHSRENETEADSLGLVLYRNAGYPLAVAVKAIQKLDSIDLPSYTKPLRLKELFNSAELAFNDNWLKPSDENVALGGNLDDFKMPDSLKTHPDCKLRAAAMKRIITREPTADTSSEIRCLQRYRDFRSACLLESVEVYLQNGLYSWALYNSLELMNRFPDNNYLKCAASLSLQEIYLAQARHDFSRVVDFPGKDYTESYNQLLIMLHNLTLSELKSISSAYYKQHVSPLRSNEFASYVGVLVNNDKKPREDFELAVRSFEKEYANSYYSRSLNDKLLSLKPTKKK